MVDLVVSCALVSMVTATAMPLGDPCSLTCLSWITCVTLDKSWTPSKPQMRENSRVPGAAVQELVSEQSQPQSSTQGFMYPQDTCSGPPLSQRPPNAMEKDSKTQEENTLQACPLCFSSSAVPGRR